MAAPPPPPQANNTAAHQAGGGGDASEYDAAVDRRWPDLDVFLKQKGLRIDWGRVDTHRNSRWHADGVSWNQGILHKTAMGSFGAVFRCLPLNPVPGSVDGPQLVVKVNIQEKDEEVQEEEQPELKLSTSYMIENAAFTCVPHVAIVRSRARFTFSSSLKAARVAVQGMSPEFRPPWLRDEVNHEFLVMDLCEGGDLLCLRPAVQPWYNPFSTLEPPEHRILLQQLLGVGVCVQGLPAGAGYRGKSTDQFQNVGGFQMCDVLVSVRWWAVCE